MKKSLPEEKEDPGLERVGERKKLGVLKMMMMMILLFQQLLFFSLSFFYNIKLIIYYREREKQWERERVMLYYLQNPNLRFFLD